MQQCKTTIEMDEFLNLLKLLYEEKECYLLRFALTLQWHIMGRIDDALKLKFENFVPNLEYPFSMNIKLMWSKNITEEREVPKQIIFGSFDHRICPIIHMAIYCFSLENKIFSSKDFIFGQFGDRNLRIILQKIWDKSCFKKLLKGPLGPIVYVKGLQHM